MRDIFTSHLTDTQCVPWAAVWLEPMASEIGGIHLVQIAYAPAGLQLLAVLVRKPGCCGKPCELYRNVFSWQ